MLINWNILRAQLHCSYKAWQFAKDISEHETDISVNTQNHITLPVRKLTPKDKLAVVTLGYIQKQITKQPIETIQIFYGENSKNSTASSFTIKISKYSKQIKKVLEGLQSTVEKDDPPVFYRNAHCPECEFRNSCYQKLKERDCISLLGGMPLKVMQTYHKKGIFSILQLSHLFRPRRRRRSVQYSGSSLWELKALALKEQKTFVMASPELKECPTSIYIDFEGLPDENFEYLIGALIKQQDKPDEFISLWADSIETEATIFNKLFKILAFYSDASIYYYGSYELKVLKQIAKKYNGIFEKELPQIEKRMVNLLSYLRTHVYPPTYSNGLKEVGVFLNFKWDDPEAGGFHSIEWRKKWELTKSDTWKQKLTQYNQDDCYALTKVHLWLIKLSNNSTLEGTQQVSKMKKHTPYKLQNNIEYGEDFQIISKAAYFDYQRTKIYWRNENKKLPKNIELQKSARHLGRGISIWQPKKAHEIIIVPLLTECPHCGHTKVYRSKRMTSVRQTDLKFTASGIKQHIIEYRAGKIKCAKCGMKTNDANLRIKHYGHNVFALLTYLYVNYHISNELVCRLFQDQFGIFINQGYAVVRKRKWWMLWQQEIDYIRQTVLKSPAVHIDETTVRLTKEGGYVWVFATAHSIFYHLTIKREAEFLKELLKDYKGVIITDFFAGYESLEVKKQKCLIHLIRDLNDELYKNPFDEEYKSMVLNFSTLLRGIIETIDKYGLKKRHLKKHISPTEKYFKKHVEKEYKSELANKCVKRLRKHWDEIWTFLQCDGVPWNNNNAEAGIKAFAQYRRGVNGQVSEAGLHEYLNMLTISQTCRYRNISFLDFLRCKAGIWQNIKPENLPGFLPFNQARLYVHKLKFKSQYEWAIWNTKNKRPIFIPANPYEFYIGKGWLGWEDWLGI